MSILKKIDGIPVFSNIQTALLWAKAHGLEGYHVHMVGNKKGYMGGSDHSTSTNTLTIDTVQPAVPRTQVDLQPVTPMQTQPPIETQPPEETTRMIPRQTGGGSGGSGGGGY